MPDMSTLMVKTALRGYYVSASGLGLGSGVCESERTRFLSSQPNAQASWAMWHVRWLKPLEKTWKLLLPCTRRHLWEEVSEPLPLGVWFSIDSIHLSLRFANIIVHVQERSAEKPRQFSCYTASLFWKFLFTSSHHRLILSEAIWTS